MVNEIVEAARSHFPPLIFVIITPMINRLFKALKAKARRLLLFFFLYARIVVHREYHLINFLINHATKEITEQRKRFCVRMQNYWFLIAWLITNQRMSEAFIISPVIGANTVYVLQLKVVVKKIDRYIFCWVIQRSRMQRCIKERSNVRRYYVDAKIEQWSVSLECFKYKTPYLLEALSARVAFKLLP